MQTLALRLALCAACVCAAAVRGAQEDVHAGLGRNPAAADGVRDSPRPGVRRLALVQTSVSIVTRPPPVVEGKLTDSGGDGGHFVHQTEGKPGADTNQNQSAALTNALPGRGSAPGVDIHCSEMEVTAEVNRDFLGNGQRVTPSDLTLGGCAASSVSERSLLFRSELHRCGAAKMMTEDSLLYTFSLVYLPTPIGNTSIIKTNAARVEIQCHYPRKLLVSSDGVRPSWRLAPRVVLVEQQLRFSLRLMTEDWQRERPAGAVYALGEVMRVEASVQRAHHAPLRLYVDRCLVALEPGTDAQPQYHFISNHGCFTDARRSGGRSYFEDRTQDEVLRFQLQTFLFPGDPRTSMFITCYLRATTVSTGTDAEHKACSFLTEANRWVASGGDNQVCSCCEHTCSTQRTVRRGTRSADPEPEWGGQASVGPIQVQGLLDPSAPHPPPPTLVFQDLGPAPGGPSASVWVLCVAGVGVASLQVTLMLLAVVLHRRSRRPSSETIETIK